VVPSPEGRAYRLDARTMSVRKACALLRTRECRSSRKAALIAWPRALPLPRNSDSDGRAVLPGNPVGVRFLLAVLILMIVGLVAQGG
jgi:hypothetical protein